MNSRHVLQRCLAGKWFIGALCVAAIPSLVCAGAHAETVSPLFARGYTVLPAPQKVSLGATDFSFDAYWQVALGNGVDRNDVAIATLREELASRFDTRLGKTGGAGGTLTLQLEPGSVPIGKALSPDKESLKEQAYRIELSSGSVTITANASPGLFYGVETFVQLLRSGLKTLWLPEGTIEDWPDMQQRHIYWDDNHHLEKLDELKRDLRQAAFYKINGFVIKLDGHFQYKSAPAVVEPYALTPAELQDLTNYGLRYHVQLIPYLDGPAHISFILKHPEYAHLQEFPDSNYEICATNPEAYKLLESMYQDLMDANQGVKYFYVSTDEAYYLGLSQNSQCNEKEVAEKLGSVGRLFAQFIDQAGGYVHDRGRTVVFWGEFPLKPADIPSLPTYLINGEVYGPVFDKAFHQHGTQQMIFSSVEGEEKLFPDYSILPQSERLHRSSKDEFEDNPGDPRVESITSTISGDSSRLNSSLIGEVNAGWADEGVHPETFWLGYVASSAAGWHPAAPSVQEMASSFYSLFYGASVVNMDDVYRRMSEQAQSWTDSWDPMPSKARKPIWGSSYEIFKPPHPAHDQTLPLPASPSAGLQYRSTWSTVNAKRIALAYQGAQANDVLMGLLHEDLQRAQFNRYNLAIFVSIAALYRQNFSMIENLHQMDAALMSASEMRIKNPAKALEQVDGVLDLANAIWRARNQALQNATATWEQRWFPNVAEANGRTYLNVVDDVKDHLPGRTVDLSYLVYREKLLPFGDWVNSIAAARNQFAAAHHLPVRDFHLSWDDLSVAQHP